MLKATNRHVFVVKPDKSSRFEAVYFVMKKQHLSQHGHESIVAEANRIIQRSGLRRSPPRRKAILLCLGSSLAGFFVCFAFCLLFYFACLS